MNRSQRADISTRAAEPGDAARITEIFNDGVEDRVATFETRPAAPEDAMRWIKEDVVIVAERDGAVIGWAKAGPYADQHHYYDGVREATLYVDRAARRAGVGRVLLDALAEAAAESGAHKLVGKIFTSNEAKHRARQGPGLERGRRPPPSRHPRRRMEGRSRGGENARCGRVDRSVAGIRVLKPGRCRRDA